MTKPTTVRDVTECLHIVESTIPSASGENYFLPVLQRARLIEVLTLIDARETKRQGRKRPKRRGRGKHPGHHR